MPQKLEYLARILESLACRIYYRVVSKKDKRNAVYFIRIATQAAVTKPCTGKINMDMIVTERSIDENSNEENLVVSLKELLEDQEMQMTAVE